MVDIAQLSIWAALLAGVISFISPCTLPLFPAYLSYITGISVKELQQHPSIRIRRVLIIHTVFFLLGVSTIFMALGIGATFMGQWLEELILGSSSDIIQRIAGIFIVFMGLLVMGVIQPRVFLKEKRISFGRRPVGLLGTMFVGMGFAAGWTPCIGPILASILLLAASNPQQGLLYTVFYSVGFALPFMTFTFFIGSTNWIKKYSETIMKVGGGFMIFMGLLLFTGQLTEISTQILRLIEGTWFENLG